MSDHEDRRIEAHISEADHAALVGELTWARRHLAEFRALAEALADRQFGQMVVVLAEGMLGEVDENLAWLDRWRGLGPRLTAEPSYRRPPATSAAREVAAGS